MSINWTIPTKVSTEEKTYVFSGTRRKDPKSGLLGEVHIFEDNTKLMKFLGLEVAVWISDAMCHIPIYSAKLDGAFDVDQTKVLAERLLDIILTDDFFTEKYMDKLADCF